MWTPKLNFIQPFHIRGVHHIVIVYNDIYQQQSKLKIHQLMPYRLLNFSGCFSLMIWNLCAMEASWKEEMGEE